MDLMISFMLNLEKFFTTERIRHLTPVRLLEEEDKKAESNKEEDEGQVFYRSPGYPAPPRSRSVTKITISGSAPPEQPIKERDTAMELEEERLVRRRREGGGE